jgi:hemerythrin superfamily protein
MAARKKAASRKAPAGKSTRKAQDALALLRSDHQLVQGLFEQFEKARGDERKGDLAERICRELTVHAQIEEEILYPAAREALREEDLLDEAEVEHASAKDLIAQIEASRPGAELFDAKVTVLGEYIKHHVKEEQNEMFPKLRKTKLDLKTLGERLQARKMALQEGRPGARPRGAGTLTGSRARGSKRAATVESEGLMAGLAREIGLKR